MGVGILGLPWQWGLACGDLSAQVFYPSLWVTLHDCVVVDCVGLLCRGKLALNCRSYLSLVDYPLRLLVSTSSTQWG